MANMENLAPADVARLLADDAILLIDVREPGEYALEHIDGAVLCPLSGFDPDALPDPGARKLVFHCAGGVRSAKAMAACAKAGVAFAGHLAGGINAWKQAGLPTSPGDPGKQQ